MSVRIAILAVIAACAGCTPRGGPEVVVYTALDSEFSEPIFAQFETETGIHVRPKFDTESTKTVGLTQAIIAEANRPQCDVFWNNEILNTLRLQKLGLLEPYPSPAAAAFPAMFRSPQGDWCGFAARARVLIVNTELVGKGERPTSIHALTEAKWRGRCAIAKPLFGTTATQAACLFATWGPEQAGQFFDALKANEVQILGGNKQVAQSVGAGRLAFGLTDTDDALSEIEAARPVAMVFPDQGPGEMGTLFIPNTVAILRGAKHPEAARRLVDALLAPATEERLAAGPSAQIPLNPSVRAKSRLPLPADVRPMQVDFAAAAEASDATAAYLRKTFSGE